MRLVRALQFLLAGWVVLPIGLTAQSNIVISQVYGGGGNSGATLRNDFVELFNRGSVSVGISGWTVQYASASGSSWDRAPLAGTVLPGQYYLVQFSQGAGGSAALPAPDAATGINLSATAGKVALVNNSTLLSGTSPSGPQMVDFVGYGDANFAEGGRAASGLTNTTAALRRSGGCIDTDSNQADFTVGQPTPRNSRSPVAPCFSTPVPQISSAGVTNAASFLGGSVAPGEIITVFGSGLGPETLATAQLTADGLFLTKALANTRVFFDGVPAAMIYTVAGQVSAVVPYAVNGRSTTDLQVEYNGRLSNGVTIDVAPSAPGIFTLDSSGGGQGAILNQNSQVNGPQATAAPGSVIVIYATGGGQTNPESEDGRISTNAARQAQDVAVRIDGVESEVLYAGAAPGLVSGVLQINARVPGSVGAGIRSIQITVGGANSQRGVVVAIAGPVGQDGTGPMIDARLEQLKRERLVAPLPEMPTDRDPIPPDWLGVISWNIQVGGTTTAAGSLRPPMVQSALGTMFGGTYQVLAAQEIPNSDSAQFLRTLLPGGESAWRSAFEDTTDSMDNGFWYGTSVVLRDSFALLTTDLRDSVGRLIVDPSRALHPPQVAQFQAGAFDFTLITVHLTFADGDTSESVRELVAILDYLDWYFNQPDHDPDVIICGDFNTPSTLSGQTGRNGITLDQVFEHDPRFQVGERRFVVTVHDPTSRRTATNGGGPANNYDHCVLSADTTEEFIQARRVDTNILTDHAEDPEVRLTSDHFPIAAFFKTAGEGISLDLRTRIRPN